jgi:hypothetical protein
METMDTPGRLESDHISAAARAHIAGFHADVVREVVAAVARDPVVVVGMAQNPHVKNVREALRAANIDFT